MSELAKIEDGNIVICIPIKDLSGQVFEGLTYCGMDNEDDVDFDILSKDMVSELNAEEEEGSTPVNRLLDKMVMNASENGSAAFQDKS